MYSTCLYTKENWPLLCVTNIGGIYLCISCTIWESFLWYSLVIKYQKILSVFGITNMLYKSWSVSLRVCLTLKHHYIYIVCLYPNLYCTSLGKQIFIFLSIGIWTQVKWKFIDIERVRVPILLDCDIFHDNKTCNKMFCVFLFKIHKSFVIKLCTARI